MSLRSFVRSAHPLFFAALGMVFCHPAFGQGLETIRLAVEARVEGDAVLVEARFRLSADGLADTDEIAVPFRILFVQSLSSEVSVSPTNSAPAFEILSARLGGARLSVDSMASPVGSEASRGMLRGKGVGSDGGSVDLNVSYRVRGARRPKVEGFVLSVPIFMLEIPFVASAEESFSARIEFSESITGSNLDLFPTGGAVSERLAEFRLSIPPSHLRVETTRGRSFGSLVDRWVAASVSVLLLAGLVFLWRESTTVTRESNSSDAIDE